MTDPTKVIGINDILILHPDSLYRVGDIGIYLTESGTWQLMFKMVPIDVDITDKPANTEFVPYWMLKESLDDGLIYRNTPNSAEFAKTIREIRKRQKQEGVKG